MSDETQTQERPAATIPEAAGELAVREPVREPDVIRPAPPQQRRPEPQQPWSGDPRTNPEFTPFACSHDIAALIEAMTEAAKDFDEVGKNKKAEVRSKREGAQSYTYAYADLDAVISATRPYLSKNGLVLFQFPIIRQRSVTILTLLTHTSDQWIRNDLPVVVESLDPQSIGSAITYARRYAQLAILNLAPADDDDGKAAVGRPQQQPRPQQAQPSQQTQPATQTEKPKDAAQPNETHAERIARVKSEAAAKEAAAKPAQAAPAPVASAPVAPAPVGPPATAPAPDATSVRVTSINVRNGPMVIKDGKQVPSWGPLYIIGFGGKVRVNDKDGVATAQFVTEATTLDEALAAKADEAKQASASVNPDVRPGGKKSTFNLVGL